MSKTYEQLGQEIGALVAEKQDAYGDSFSKSGQVMSILYPAGVPPEKMGDALTVVRVLDKLFRIATDRDALGESPWRDIAGYALLSVKRVEDGYALLSVKRVEDGKAFQPHVGCRWCGQSVPGPGLGQFCNSMCRKAWEEANGIAVEAKP